MALIFFFHLHREGWGEKNKGKKRNRPSEWRKHTDKRKWIVLNTWLKFQSPEPVLCWCHYPSYELFRTTDVRELYSIWGLVPLFAVGRSSASQGICVSNSGVIFWNRLVNRTEGGHPIMIRKALIVPAFSLFYAPGLCRCRTEWLVFGLWMTGSVSFQAVSSHWPVMFFSLSCLVC